MPKFRNPNDPEQPQIGVYRWLCERNNKKKTLYVGSAGKKITVLPKGTLFRGVLQSQKGMKISTDKGKSLDVDFVIGCAIQIFEENGWECYWEHIDNDPEKEINICKKYNPILQNQNARLLSKFKHTNEENWDDNGKLDLAIQLLIDDLKDEL